MNSIFKNILLFIGLVLFQTLVLNNVNVGGWVNPYIYPVFILLLPMDIAGWAILLLAFTLGLSIDVFAGTLGMHTFATVFMAALRPVVIDRISQRNQELTKRPSAIRQGFTWMLIYLSFLTAAHHLVYFLIEYWSVWSLGTVFVKFVLNTVISVFIMFLLLYAFQTTKKK